MTLTEPRGIEFVRRLGVERVILARELSLNEIQKIAGCPPIRKEIYEPEVGIFTPRGK